MEYSRTKDQVEWEVNYFMETEGLEHAGEQDLVVVR